jgi:hypothetical protein
MKMVSNSALNRLFKKAKHSVSKEEKNKSSVRSRKRLEKEEPLESQEKKAKGSSSCLHEFGYLAKRAKDDPIPDECYTCSKILDCMRG